MIYTKKILLVLIVLLLSIGAIFPLLHNGFFEFHDNTQVVRVFEMGRSLADGMFPVRWSQDLGYGYGYPIFNFYSPLPYYIGGFFFLSGFDTLFSTKLMFIVGILFSGVSMFFFSKKFFGIKAGLVSSIIYMYFPYHAVNIYVRGAVGEFFAYAFLPLVFLGFYSLIEIKKEKSSLIKSFGTILFLSFSIFFLATSHNLSLYMLLLILVPFFVLSLFLVKTKKQFFIVSFISIILGLALSSFYIIPAFSEMKYTNVASQVGMGADFRDHFVCLQQYWNSIWGYGGSVKGCVDGLSFRLGKANIILLLVVFILLGINLWKRKFRIQEKTVVISFVLLLVSLFFTFQISETVWNLVPFMQYLQYPWRFINFIALFISFIAGYGIFFAGKKEPVAPLIVSFIAIVIIIATSLKLFMPQYYTFFGSRYYTNKTYINYDVSKISDEYMPVGFLKPQSGFQIPKENAYFEKNSSLKIISSRANYQKFEFNLTSPSELFINTAYFPAWKAYANGKELQIIQTNKGMKVLLPQGEGVVELKFVQTPIEVFGNLLSLISFLSMIIGIIIVQKKHYGK